MRAMIVGAGCCGASAARRLAEYGWQVTVIDRRDHVGGNAYDRRDGYGILYHVYGPHIFFTDEKRVWSFLHPFAQWVSYQGDVRVWLEGMDYPMPFQPSMFLSLLPEQGEDVLAAMRKRWPNQESVTVLDLLNADNTLLTLAGQRLYGCDCAPYNQKQWGLRPEELSPEVIARAPVYLNDQKYFRSERFQFMPTQGFTSMFQAMLDHPAIEVLTGVDALNLFRVSNKRIVWKTDRTWDVILYTGPLDRLFSYPDGALPYRTLRFDMEYGSSTEGLPCLSMYYPAPEVPWTRRTDYRYIPGNSPDMAQTLLIGERPVPVERPEDEPYYVVLTEQSKALYQRYRRMLEQVPHLYAAGRLADFCYYNMDKAVARGLDIADEIHHQEGMKQC